MFSFHEKCVSLKRFISFLSSCLFLSYSSLTQGTQRILVFGLLEGVKGIPIHEDRRIDRRDHKAKRSAMQQYIEVEQKPAGGRGEQSPQLEGVA
jgi:hypothetical protein